MYYAVDFIIHTSLSLIIGLIIGMERYLTGHPVNIKTTAIVAFGACLFGLYSNFATGDVVDTRVPAQVVTGVGFICSAVIFKGDRVIHGLNSAATIWATAGIGLLCSFDNVSFALLATGLLVGFNLLFGIVERLLEERQGTKT